MVLAVPARGIGRQALLRKGAQGVADHLVFFGQNHGVVGPSQTYCALQVRVAMLAVP
jgi:hypothetical protein